MDAWLVKEEPDAEEQGLEDSTEEALEVQPKKKAPPNRHGDDDPGAPAPGEPDPRQTSLAQRHVFKTSRYLIAKEALEKYDFYKSKECKEKGKEKMANEIINAHVPRNTTWGGCVQADKFTMNCIMTRTAKEKRSERHTGLPKLIFIASVFHNNQAAFDAARNAGECWEEHDGMWYYLTKDRSFTDRKEKTDTASAKCPRQ